MWLTDGFLVTFLEGGREQCAYTSVTYTHMSHVQLMCRVEGGFRRAEHQKTQKVWKT